MAGKRVGGAKKRAAVKGAGSSSILLNSLIGALSVVILLFAYSLYDKGVRRDTHLTEYRGSSLEDTELPTALIMDQATKAAETDLVVQVLNGSGVAGIAASYKDALIAQGVDVINVGNAPNYHYERSLLYYHGLNADKAYQFAEMIGLERERIEEQDLTSLGNELTLILGRDYRSLKMMSVPEVAVRLQILNGCGVNGISREYQKFLQSKGFQIVDVSNASSFNFQESVLRYDNDGVEEDVKNITFLLGLDESQVRRVPQLDNANISLIIGQDHPELALASNRRTR